MALQKSMKGLTRARASRLTTPIGVRLALEGIRSRARLIRQTARDRWDSNIASLRLPRWVPQVGILLAVGIALWAFSAAFDPSSAMAQVSEQVGQGVSQIHASEIVSAAAPALGESGREAAIQAANTLQSVTGTADSAAHAIVNPFMQTSPPLQQSHPDNWMNFVPVELMGVIALIFVAFMMFFSYSIQSVSSVLSHPLSSASPCETELRNRCPPRNDASY